MLLANVEQQCIVDTKGGPTNVQSSVERVATLTKNTKTI